MKLHYNSNDTDDNNVSNPKDMGIGDGSASSSQCLEPNLGPSADFVPSIVPIHSKCPSRRVLPSWTCFSMRQERPLIQML